MDISSGQRCRGCSFLPELWIGRRRPGLPIPPSPTISARPTKISRVFSECRQSGNSPKYCPACLSFSL